MIPRKLLFGGEKIKFWWVEYKFSKRGDCWEGEKVTLKNLIYIKEREN